MKYKKLDYNTKDLKTLKISELKRIADYWFRQYLLSKATKKGSQIYCPIKQRFYTQDKIHVAHYYDRNIMCLRYSEDNCHLVSSQSNMWDAQIPDENFKSKHHKDYHNYLLKEKSQSFLDDLKGKSNNICIFGFRDYIELIEKFRNV